MVERKLSVADQENAEQVNRGLCAIYQRGLKAESMLNDPQVRSSMTDDEKGTAKSWITKAEGVEDKLIRHNRPLLEEVVVKSLPLFAQFPDIGRDDLLQIGRIRLLMSSSRYTVDGQSLPFDSYVRNDLALFFRRMYKRRRKEPNEIFPIIPEEDVEDIAIRNVQTTAILQTATRILSPRDLDIFLCNFELHPDSSRHATNVELGERYGGISRERVRQIERAVIGKLRKDPNIIRAAKPE